MKVTVRDLSFSYDKKVEILKGICFDAVPGKMTVIIGANGAGKTTALKCVAGLYKHEGEVLFDGQVLKYSDLVEHLSYMEQNTDCTMNLDVFTIVMLGKHQSLGFKPTKSDIQDVKDVLELVGVKQLASKKIGEISGGQRQLVFLAQALVKKPKVLLLDEPTGALDLFHQIKLMKFVKKVTQDRDCVTIMTLHHLDMAMKYADHVVVISNNSVYQQGPPSEVFTEKMLRDVYRVECEILVDSHGERYMHVIDFDEESAKEIEKLGLRQTI